MKSIQRRFNIVASKNPNFSSYLCFADATKGQGFSKQTIHRWFYKLVEKDDYFKNEVGQILKHLVWLSENKKAVEDDKIQG